MGKKATIQKLQAMRDKYVERFGDIFPSFQVPIYSDEDHIAKIQKCLDQNKPAEILFDIRDDAEY